MSDEYELHARPALEAPVLVVCLHGWIDAGAGAASAMEVLENEVADVEVATFDADRFIDYRARRPVMHLRDGVNEQLVWPEIRMRAGQDSRGNDVLLLTGHEPDTAWRAFVQSVSSLAIELGATQLVGLGAYPYAAPHTRPPRLSVTASTPALAAGFPYGRNSLDVPAGVQAALERRFDELGRPAIGLWAQVPHYVSNFPYPAASLALLTGLAELTGISVDGERLRSAAESHRQQLDGLVEANPEHIAMVQQLEAAYDAETMAEDPLPAAEDLPSGEELAAELEKYLREQGS